MKTNTEIKAYTISELAAIYKVCSKTFKKWIEPFAEVIGEKRGRYYNVNQVKIIFEKIGIPHTVETF